MPRKEKWQVYGEYGGTFTNLKDASRCAKAASELQEDKCSEVWLIEDGCYYIKYQNGKLAYDGWTTKNI